MVACVCMRVCVHVRERVCTSVCTQKQASARVNVRGRLSVCTCDFVCHACVYNVINHVCHVNKHMYVVFYLNIHTMESIRSPGDKEKDQGMVTS